MGVQQDSWAVIGYHITNELKRLSENDEKHFECEKKHEIDIAVLQVKAGIWGFIAGLIPAAVALIWMIVKK